MQHVTRKDRVIMSTIIPIITKISIYLVPFNLRVPNATPFLTYSKY